MDKELIERAASFIEAEPQMHQMTGIVPKTSDLCVAFHLAEQKREWMRVEDELPERTGEYLVQAGGGYITFAYWYDGRWTRYVRVGESITPIAWMPIPSYHPAEEKQDVDLIANEVSKQYRKIANGE